MRKTPTTGKRSRPKMKLAIPDLEHSKSAVLRSLGSPDSRRGIYASEFMRHRFNPGSAADDTGSP
jgi:hypothetical protein